MRRQWTTMMLVGAVMWGCVGVGLAEESDPPAPPASSPQTKEQLERALVEKAKRERKEDVDRKIRLLEALEGSAEAAPKAVPREKVGGPVRILPTGPRETVTVEWIKTFEQGGEIETSLKTQRYGTGRVQTSATTIEPDRIQFTTEQENWRIGWVTETVERSGRLKMKLMRKVTLPSGLTKWVPHTPLPSMRAGQSGGSYSTGKGEFMLELTGLDVKYKIFVEEPKIEKTVTEQGEMKKPEAEEAGEKKEGEPEKKAEEGAEKKVEEKKTEETKVQEKKAE